MEERVILVDANDIAIGEMEKLAAHWKGMLHRAFSVFVFNSKNELLLQRRALGKYHSEGLWTNTCCSHPRPGEEILEAAHRRLKEEMGFDCPLREVHAIVYRTEFPNCLIENEYDHLLVGEWDGKPILNLGEADDFNWISVEELRTDLHKHPEKYTYWLRLAFEDLVSKKG